MRSSNAKDTHDLQSTITSCIETNIKVYIKLISSDQKHLKLGKNPIKYIS